METIKQIFDNMDNIINKFQKETKAIFDDWHRQNQKALNDCKKNIRKHFKEARKKNAKIFDDWQINHYNEYMHAQFMLKVGGKQNEIEKTKSNEE